MANPLNNFRFYCPNFSMLFMLRTLMTTQGSHRLSIKKMYCQIHWGTWVRLFQHYHCPSDIKTFFFLIVGFARGRMTCDKLCGPSTASVRFKHYQVLIQYFLADLTGISLTSYLASRTVYFLFRLLTKLIFYNPELKRDKFTPRFSFQPRCRAAQKR